MPVDAFCGEADFGPGSFAVRQVDALAVGPILFVLLEDGRLAAHWKSRALGASPAFTLHEDGTNRPLLHLEMEDGPGGRPSGRPFRVTSIGRESLGRISRESSSSGWRLLLQPATGQLLAVTFSGKRATLDAGLGSVTRKPEGRGFGRYPADNYEVDVQQPLSAPLPALLVAAPFADSLWSGRAKHKPGEAHLMKDLAGALGAALSS
jgi:hypothetical protein